MVIKTLNETEMKHLQIYPKNREFNSRNWLRERGIRNRFWLMQFQKYVATGYRFVHSF